MTKKKKIWKKEKMQQVNMDVEFCRLFKREFASCGTELGHLTSTM